MEILITEEFKKTISQHIEMSESGQPDSILTTLIEQGHIDEEYGHLIFPERDKNNFEYNLKTDLLVLDALEDEIKRQLLTKFNK
jgi:hypothetical protein